MRQIEWGLILGLSAACLLFAPGVEAAGAGNTAAADQKENELQGRVQSVDRSSNTMTVAGSQKTLEIDASTEVLKGGSRASIADVREGDEVRASFSGSGDTLHVRKLEVMATGSSGSGEPDVPILGGSRGRDPSDPSSSSGVLDGSALGNGG